MRHLLHHPLIRMNQGVVCLCVEGQVVMPRAAGYSPVDVIPGDGVMPCVAGHLAPEGCCMTAADQGRRRHAPRSGVVARRWNIGRGRDAPRSEVLALASHYMTAVNQGQRTRRP